MEPDYFFCPNPSCANHRLDPPDGHWFYYYGYHHTKAFGTIQRYKCKHCGTTFSDQTFLLNYWLKKKTDFAALGREINSSSSCCFVGRHNTFSVDSMRIRIDRLARNSLQLKPRPLGAVSVCGCAFHGLSGFPRLQQHRKPPTGALPTNRLLCRRLLIVSPGIVPQSDSYQRAACRRRA